jgi:hypothetical protein
MEGRSMSMVLSPDKKAHEAALKAAAEAAAENSADATPPVDVVDETESE